MNRKQRRELRKDKNLIRNLYAIIKKYLPELFNKFYNLTDSRNQSYVNYDMKVICVTRLFGLLCGLTSLSILSDDEFNTDACIDNISTICKTKLNELRDIQKYVVKALIRSKMFDKYKYNGAFQLLFDGTGLSNHNYNLNSNCLQRKHKDGKISYYKYVLECRLCVGNIVISLDSEFIENEEMLTEKQKQDCETNAFKRMIERIGKNYPRQKFIITGDGLYATVPIIKICNKNKWFYIFNLKPERLKEINSSFEGNIVLENETKIKNYYLSTNIAYKDIVVNAFKSIEKNKNGKETTFRYISNITVNNDNMQRYRCKNCNTSFTAKSKSIFATTKLEKEKWLKYIECFVDCLSLRRCAEKVGVCLKTSYFMRHRILECLKKNQSQFIVNKDNKGQLDEAFLRENFKGNHSKSINFSMPRKPRKNGQEAKMIGSSNEQICIASGINDTNHVFFEIAGRGQLTNQSLKQILENKIEEGAIISTDKRSNYKTILKLFNVREHNTYQSNTKENYKNLGNINSLHSRFKNFIRQMHGMATRRLENYLVWFTWIENFKRNENKNELIINSLSINKYDTTIREYKNTPYLYMEYWNS